VWGGGEQKRNRERQTAARKSRGGILHSAALSALLLCTVRRALHRCMHPVKPCSKVPIEHKSDNNQHMHKNNSYAIFGVFEFSLFVWRLGNSA